MRRLKKGEEPSCLGEARREVKRQEKDCGSEVEDPWSLLKNKDELQKALCRDQGGLCAYCGGRIVPENMKIEHFIPRSKERSLCFKWSNLLGVCQGRYSARDSNGRTQTITHCDSHRSEWHEGPPEKGLLFIHPVESGADPETLFLVRCTGSFPAKPDTHALGTILPKTDEAKQDCEELNLNAYHLVRNRAQVIIDLRAELQSAGDNAPQLIKKRLKAAECVTGDLPAYAHVEIAYLRRKLQSYS